MVEELGRPAAGRPGRCAAHPGAPEVGRCSSCARALCASCAVPVRGELVGPECLSKVLGDVTPAPPVAAADPNRGDRVAVAGFGVVVLLSVLPWSRYGDSSGIFGAWRPHWSLLAVVSAVAGAAFVGARWRPAIGSLVEAFVLGALALLTGATSILHYYHPPPLSAPSIVPLIASVGAAVALLGAGVKAGAALRTRRSLP